MRNTKIQQMFFIVSILMFFAVSAVMIFFGKDIYFNLTDSRKWIQLSSQMNDSKVSKVVLESGNPIELIGNEKSDFVQNLSKAKFYKSNWRKQGPTGRLITVIFNDGSKESFQYWGNAIFETTYNNGQFLIKTIEIENVLKKYNINFN